MNDVGMKICARANAFVQKLSVMILGQAFPAMKKILRSSDGFWRVRVEEPHVAPKTTNKAAARPAPKTVNVSMRHLRGRRTQAELKAIKRRVHDYIRANPDHNIEFIAQELGMLTKDLALPLQKLIEAGEIVTQGERRATRYSAG